MTTEDQRYWHGRTWRIAFPVIITNVSVPLLGAVDTAVVGRLPGPEYVGAVAVGAMIFAVIYHGCNFLRMGTTGLTAQSYGARDGNAVRTWLGRSLLLGMVLGLLFIAIQWPIYEAAKLIVAPSDAVEPLTNAYYDIRIWGAPAAMANFALLGWFLGTQNVKAALVTQLYMNGVNIVLDLWFVIGLDWGVPGVAWATLIAEWTALGLGLAIAAVQMSKFGGRFELSALMETAPLKRMLGVNTDIFLRSACIQVVLVVVTAVGSRMGDTILAANAILLQIQIFFVYALDGFANAAEALAGEAKGAKKREDFNAAIRSTTIWAAVFAVGSSAATWALGPFLIDLLTTVTDVRETARVFLVWSILMPLLSVWSFQLDGIFIGCTWTREMRNCMFLSVVLFLATAWALQPIFGNHGLWAAFAVLMIARAITMGWSFKRLRLEIGEPNTA